MEMNEALEVPVVETIGGKSVTFPLVEIEDYLPMIAEVTAQRRRKARALIPPDTSPQDKFQMLQVADGIEIGLQEIGNVVFTVPGAIKILRLSLAKASMTKDEQDAVIKAIRPKRLHSLAMEVSGIFARRVEPAPPPKTKSVENADPNSPSPAESENPDGVIGAGIESL